jgi:hypothetical protein
MNLQYIYDNSTNPPTQSRLQYSVNPDTVFVSTATQTLYANLTVMVFNPQSVAVTCQLFQLGFYVGAAYGDLTSEKTGIQASSDQTTLDISKDAAVNPDFPTLYQFSVPATGMANFSLAAGQSLVFRLGGVVINKAVGAGGTKFVILEATGTAANPAYVQGAITISKQTPTLNIGQFTADPPIPINPGANLTLKWQVTGSDRRQLYNVNTGALLYDSAKDDPSLTSYVDRPQRNTTYQLIAWAGQLFTAQQTNAMVNAPQFLKGPYADPPSVKPGATTTFRWETAHADNVTIAAPGFVTVSVPASQGHYVTGPVNTQTPFTLTAGATGIAVTDIKQVTVPVELPTPSVTSFAANPGLSAQDGRVSLSWETAYASSATLGQEVLGTSVKNDLGTVGTIQSAYKTSPAGISRYTLKAFGQGGQVQSSVIAAQQKIIPIDSPAATPVVTEAMMSAGHKFEVSVRGGMATDLIFDGANVWVANWWSVIKIDAAAGSVAGSYGGRDTSPIFTPFALACRKGGGSIFALSQNDCYVVKLKTDDGSVQATYKGSTFGTPTYYPNGLAIAVDDKYIWVAYYLTINRNPGAPLEYDGAYVSKLDINSGQILNTTQYKLADAATQFLPGSIASDGSSVWVISTSSNSRGLYKLSAADGTLQGTYLQDAAPSYVVYDGSNIWVSCRGDGSVKQLDGSGNVLKNLPIAGASELGRPLVAQGAVGVSGVIYHRDTGASEQIFRLMQTSDGGTLASFTLPNYFRSLAFDGTCFWLLAWSGDQSYSAIKL